MRKIYKAAKVQHKVARLTKLPNPFAKKPKDYEELERQMKVTVLDLVNRGYKMIQVDESTYTWRGY